MNKLVDPPTILPNLAVGASEGRNVSHLDHGLSKIKGERGRVGGVGADDGVGGSAIEELLVGVEEALLLKEVVEVGVVEEGGTLKIKRSQIVVP